MLAAISSLTTWYYVIGICGFLILVAGIFGRHFKNLFAAGMAQTTITLLQEQNTAQEATIRRLEHENQMQGIQMEKQQQQINQLTSELGMMKDMISGTTAINKLQSRIEEMHSEVMDALTGS